MASKVRGFGRRVEMEETDVKSEVETAAQVHQPAFVDKAILNEAVEDTLEHAEPRHADSMRKLWAMDQDSEAARIYFADQVRKRMQTAFAELNRREHVVNEVLTQEEAAKVSDYAREFSLIFRNAVGNDHSFFSARRGIDHQILLSKYPPTLRYLDFGGSALYHARMGNTNATVVSPFDIDPKDPTRSVLTKLALRKMATDESLEPVVREMARSMLSPDSQYYRSESVQTTTAKALASIAVHVYDVPIQDWPYMMERCGVKVHEGCVHFVNDFFESDEGEFEFSGARYEIDKVNDVFRMRVGRSSSQWYTHKWSDFMRYGANQVLHTPGARYSYQITERRQDTIFYRILRVDSATLADTDQVYALPSVPMVEVSGFEVFPDLKPAGASSRRSLVRRNYIFPHALWERMLTYATAELDRGGLSYDKMFNYYRTVVPRQSINQVTFSGGQAVPLMDVPALIVMAAVVAYGDSILMQRSIRARTDQIQKERQLREEGTLMKALHLFVAALVASGKLVVSPFSAWPDKVTSVYLNLMEERLVTWKPQVKLRSLNAALFVDHKSLGYSVQTPDQIMYQPRVDTDNVARLVDLSAADPQVARELLSVCGDSMTKRVKKKMESYAITEASLESETSDATLVNGSVVVEKPGVTWYDKDGKRIRRTVYSSADSAAIVRERRLAVQEAIVECNEESKALRYTCERICREVLVNGRPNENIMRARCEELYNPDLWYVRNGVLLESVLNPSNQSFSYSGVYVPYVEKGQESLVSVREEGYDGLATTTGKTVKRLHFVLPFKYTGYVLVLDGLKIFNGPAVADTLARVLDMSDSDFGFRLTCHQGPPGCGKTTTVAKDGDPSSSVFLAPTRVAKTGLADRLAKNHNIDARRVWLICRTLDSLMVNYITLPDAAKLGFMHLFVDEYVLARSGKWIAAAVLLGVKEVHAYGDSKQITHKPRVQVPKLFIELKPQVLEEEFLTFRNAPQILAAFNFVYNNEIRTKSEYVGRVVRVKHMSDVKWMGSCRLLSMYQADKKYLNEVAQRQIGTKPDVNTVHEAQGSDCDQVVLYNGEVRKRAAEDSFYLYGLFDYCLVALSRARKEVIYVKMSDEPDIVTKMIENSNDVRRVEACKEIATQGTNNINFG